MPDLHAKFQFKRTYIHHFLSFFRNEQIDSVIPATKMITPTENSIFNLS